MGYKAVVMGTSMGGINALKSILTKFDQNFPVPILIVQHMSSHSNNFLANYLNEICKIEVKEADEKEKVIPGYAYIAPPNYHLLIEKDGYISLSVEEKINFARPSIDVLFETAADAYRHNLIGVILTGANRDGAKGLKIIKERGGLVIVEDPTTAESSMMPFYAINEMKVDYIVNLQDIGDLLNQLIGWNK
ncbi:chemotaxis protein CheB [Serpentinicella alkaliphila]|uniref:protein-glutamate methylesterase n=1 Tax=Serpentinicella alkaliphila TaxID=1734049 RepID=A0A4R2TDJ7_9FIRM|nr:chemotaxis protein CheB [Serpentinicella alkaliphila]QUH25401.1 chemotaxis protein CheB [Serpentinicella alkaliphila]TCQ00606.1 two-component system chemotaxis response regulator CheB [Serpentinicella alkaliphila]